MLAILLYFIVGYILTNFFALGVLKYSSSLSLIMLCHGNVSTIQIKLLKKR